MATRWYNLQEILAEVAHDGDLSEFEDGTDESDTESESESENSENSADEASNFVNDQELGSDDSGMYFYCFHIWRSCCMLFCNYNV